MQKFIVLFVGRCGGTWLASLLRSVPEIYMQNEVFGGICRNLSGKNDVVPPPITESDLAKYKKQQKTFLEKATVNMPNKFYKGIPSGDETAAGFLLKYRQILDEDDFIDFIQQNNCKIIYLKRENILKQTVSYFGGYHSKKINGSYNVVGDSKPVGSFEETPQNILEKIKEYDKDNIDFERFLENKEISFHGVTYEELCEDSNSEMNKILEYIGINPQEHYSTDTKKNLKSSVRDSLVNYDEIYEVLKKTKYAEFLE